MGIRLHALAETILRVYPGLTFTIMEVGARPLGGKGELFHQLLEFFPGSRILAFELEESLCEELNAKAPAGIRYFPVALGRTEEQRLLFETVHPMCSSLYKPAEQLLKRYHNLQVATLKAVHVVDTVSIDTFLDAQSISDLDFIKIDIQGAELDAFIGGSAALQKTVAIVSEVEFVPLYQKQPLFGDVCSFLAGQGLMFHKFLAMSGRTLQPIVINNNPNFATQQMWSDAMFIKHLDGVDGLPSEKLLKLGLLAFMYGSPDVAFYCFSLFDKQHGSSVRNAVLEQ